MPYVRVNNSKSQTHRQALEFGPPNMKRVPISKFLSTHRKETNLHQSDIVASTVTSGIFQPASAHLPFSKNNSQIKKCTQSLFNPDRWQQSRLMTELPTAVTTGAERVSAFKELMPPSGNLRNTPFNVQKQRHHCFDKVSASVNTSLYRLGEESTLGTAQLARDRKSHLY